MNTTICHQKPPTLPLHRCPSWEGRIYALVQASLASATSSSSAAAQSLRSNRDILSQPLHLLLSSGPSGFPLHANIDSQPLPVATTIQSNFRPEGPTPVYTCHNGFACQVKAHPLSDLSSDDSDNEHSNCSPKKRPPLAAAVDGDCDYDVPPDALIESAAKLTLDQFDLHVKNKLTDTAASVGSPFRACTDQHHHHNSPLPVSKFKNRHPTNRNSVAKFAEEPQQIAQKKGFLLCCKQKSWKQRYFVLNDSQFWYYRSQSDASKSNKPAGRIELNASTRISRPSNSNTIQITYSTGKNISLTADSMLTIEEWLSVSISIFNSTFI